MITDYDCWHEDEEDVSGVAVMEVIAAERQDRPGGCSSDGPSGSRRGKRSQFVGLLSQSLITGAGHDTRRRRWRRWHRSSDPICRWVTTTRNDTHPGHQRRRSLLARACGSSPAKALERLGEVVMVAPDREQSASGHALTLHRPLRMREHEPGVYSVDGTPTDCVNLAVLWLLRDTPPDIVVSGINFGLNLGDDVTYSGTVSATFEGVLLRVPSVAFSQDLEEGYSFARSAELAALMIESLLRQELSEDLLLNVNFPAAPPRGVRFTRLGYRVYEQVVVEKTDPTGPTLLLDRRLTPVA